jgi:signal peptidase II
MYMIRINKGLLIEKWLPFLLTALIIAADQLSKAFIVRNWPIPDGRVIADIGDGLLQIIHVRNVLIAFSLGTTLPEILRPALFIVLPILVLVFLLFYYFKSPDWTRTQRWALAGILGGGTGNIIDRIFAPGGIKGVVDFISVKFFGIFGFERWPTFNIADASVVVCVILWLITMIAAGDPIKSGKK